MALSRNLGATVAPRYPESFVAALRQAQDAADRDAREALAAHNSAWLASIQREQRRLAKALRIYRQVAARVDQEAATALRQADLGDLALVLETRQWGRLAW